MEPENSVEVKNVFKAFRLYHEKKNSLYEYIASLYRKNTYERLIVLDDVSFSAKKGEMLGIIGLNGSGKTTLLKLIAKIYSPDKGSVSTLGRITPFLELGTGFNGELTARDNIILYGIILGFTKKEIIQKIDEIAKFAELEKFLDTKLKNFSTGMNARLAFSTAVQVDPDILLVDEVLSVGDLPFQKKSFNAFMNFKKKGKTIIFVSHSIDQVQQICDKVILLHKGKIHSSGKPQDVVNIYKELVTQYNSTIS